MNSNRVVEILSNFKTINLNETDKVKFLKRTDTKFVFHREKLDNFLIDLSNDYKVLIIKNKTTQKYKTTYFDTKDFSMYLAHHNGVRDRYKVRCRHYLNSNEYFLEIKKKNNKNVTSKKRIKINELNIDNNSIAQSDFISLRSPYTSDKLYPALESNFTRITLVQETIPERITIDFDFFVCKPNTKNEDRNNSRTDTSNLCIIEIKRNAESKNNSLADILKTHKIYRMRFSKFCMGLVFIKSDLKLNNFKPRLLLLKKNRIIT